MFKHLKKIKMSYIDHFNFSIGLSKDFLIACYQALIHAIYPDIFITSSTDSVKKIDKKIKKLRSKL